jgi:hypothetical protein
MKTNNSEYYAELCRQRAGASELFEEIRAGFLVPYVKPAICAVVHPAGGIVRRKTEVLS